MPYNQGLSKVKLILSSKIPLCHTGHHNAARRDGTCALPCRSSLPTHCTHTQTSPDYLCLQEGDAGPPTIKTKWPLILILKKQQHKTWFVKSQCHVRQKLFLPEPYLFLPLPIFQNTLDLRGQSRAAWCLAREPRIRSETPVQSTLQSQH